MSAKEIIVPSGAAKASRRVGRGPGSGKGKTSGKGHKGQNARSGGGVRPGFEGGQMPLYRRLPRRGFNNGAFRKEYAVLNLEILNEKFNDNEVVNLETLKQKRIIRRSVESVKILGNGRITKKLTVEVPAISASAKLQIESAGGKVVLVTPSQVENNGQ
ncbi:50S ribosomal protein L15 [Spirochaeta thermophila]|uniref:Large ribosomal subunit protein uL15 n=1 Tax=Winmispira thermophila (strain ATCC 49972 / DSM 6192 / RI 19.B1) TaxID=665571 RepID=E0RQA0_WINT6|nr:50S ribosomal protein L15 [Spirochaeta thermophila]ADN01484.1 50S ribosomal protein L15 [Spirochaeta thermophila DSM 6192]